VIAWQVAVVVALAVVLFIMDIGLGKALLLGGMTIAVPNLVMAWASTRRKPGGWLLAHAVLKFVFATTLMAVALKSFAPDPLGFFGGVVAALVAHVIGSFRWQRASNAAGAVTNPGEQ